MNMLKLFLKIVIFIAGVVIAAWFFMPWQQVGETALIFAGRAQDAPALSWTAVSAAPGGFSVENLGVRSEKMMNANVSFGTLTIVPDIVFSILNMSPACRISFTGSVLGEIAVTPLKKIAGITFGDGRLTAAYFRQGLLLEGLRSDGDLSMSGTMLLNPSGRIQQADVTMNVKSEQIEKELFPSLRMAFNLPLEQEAPGRWVLRRAEGSAQ